LCREKWGLSLVFGAGLAGEVLVALSLVPIAAALEGSFSAPSGSNPYALIWGTAKGWAALVSTLLLSALAATVAVALAAAAVVRWAGRLSRASGVLGIAAALSGALPMPEGLKGRLQVRPPEEQGPHC
jgi:ABC-type spermidine/putrescine transport system permease subunit II